MLMKVIPIKQKKLHWQKRVSFLNKHSPYYTIVPWYVDFLTTPNSPFTVAVSRLHSIYYVNENNRYLISIKINWDIKTTLRDTFVFKFLWKINCLFSEIKESTFLRSMIVESICKAQMLPFSLRIYFGQIN